MSTKFQNTTILLELSKSIRLAHQEIFRAPIKAVELSNTDVQPNVLTVWMDAMIEDLLNA